MSKSIYITSRILFEERTVRVHPHSDLAGEIGKQPVTKHLVVEVTPARSQGADQ